MYCGTAGQPVFLECSAAAIHSFYSCVPVPKHSHRAVLGQKLISSINKSMETKLCVHTFFFKFCSIRSLYTM